MPDIALFIRPLDVLSFRGNRIFGEAGSYGVSQMPPQPSVAAGALRSALMVSRGIDPHAFAEGRLEDPDLGHRDAPGRFRLTHWQLARHDGLRISPLYRPPSDLVAKRDDEGGLRIERVRPRTRGAGISCSGATPDLAVLPESSRGKPVSGYWLDEQGWSDYLAGQTPAPAHWIPGSELWQTEIRTGVGLEPVRRCADDGKLFTTQAISLMRGNDSTIGFLARVHTADCPARITLRLGGDGHAAEAETVEWQPAQGDLQAMAQAGHARLILTTPGLFTEGWTPGDGAGVIRAPGIRGRITCAAVPRAEIISGYDLALRRPKSARRVAPVGSVYWVAFDEVSPQALADWLDAGLWSTDSLDRHRRAEGYNRFTLAIV
ncbi:type III-B CRISPR module-associated Cmr3 family protein [Ectothiorhodospira lacustris]|uniref:type III-B CRISPR module-associated Cmr3 family protein n=1 Tax=Ectothiorhodospira TaxID=1051 RepID=UPI001EE9642C|nr:type III-B CRISPR module-associated Cmr3 family protein [Ectothiorhodospira lacustris]MCG5502081.1 type III-B CRISPR module-associated protein Cmr3 [Ectothiorhodospira lacustris]